MPKIALQSLPPGDTLFRLLRPGQWDRDSDYVDPAAFRDAHKPNDPGLSMNWACMTNAYATIVKFCGYSGVQRDYGNPTPEDLLRLHGFGVAKVLAGAVYALGLDFVKDKRGFIKIDAHGHLEVLHGRTRAADFAMEAKIMGLDEIMASEQYRA